MNKNREPEIDDTVKAIDSSLIGDKLFSIVKDLYPICRSITGDGIRVTLDYLSQTIPLSIHEVASGTAVFDWFVPKEWNIRDAYIKDSSGRTVVDFKDSNLHVVSYSIPIHAKMNREDLRTHLHSLPDKPSWIPYRTSYYNKDWGFCIENDRLSKLNEDLYEVFIDSSLEDGSLTYGEYFLPGTSKDEILISTHICHPSLANDNLSGIAICTVLADILSRTATRYSYRFLFIPGTIGSITWLAKNRDGVGRIKHGLVAACLGDSGGFSYKRSRHGIHEIDRAVEHILKRQSGRSQFVDFTPYGYDERQFCSPGFNMPVGCLMRTPNGQYPEYHTSADDLSLVRPRYLAESLRVFLQIFEVLEGNGVYRTLNPYCEPQLGRRGLYDLIGGREDAKEFQMALLWVLNLSDGTHSLLDIADRAATNFVLIRGAANALLQTGLLEEIEPG